MTTAQRDSRPTGLGPVGWLWWPVVMAGWTLAVAVMGAEMAIAMAPVGLGKGKRP